MTALVKEKEKATTPRRSASTTPTTATTDETPPVANGVRQQAHHGSNLKMSAFQRLNIGPSRPGHLKDPALKILIDPTWTHMGGEPATPFIEKWKARWMRYRQWIDSTLFANSKRVLQSEAILKRTNFLPFHYEMGKRINLAAGKYSFIYSENYFQRFFIDEADAQFRECFRLLEDGGVLRIVVPDADLRTYDQPDPLGFPQNLPWNAAAKHKTRWTIYSLVYALENCGYHVKPIAWCDKFGDHHYEVPRASHPAYKNTADTRFAFDLSYCPNARRSLVVDAVKPATGEFAPVGHLVSQLHPVTK